MFCSNCGNQLDDGMKFCSNCGKQIATSTENPLSDFETLKSTTKTKKEKTNFQKKVLSL